MMSLLRYIKGLRKGKDAHRIELEAMKYSFLSEALEGYDAVEDNHLRRISRIKKQIKNRTNKKNKGIIITQIPKRKPEKPKAGVPRKEWSIAASFLLCLSLGAYYLVVNYESFFGHREIVIAEHHKTESPVYEENTNDPVNLQQDTLIIYMPELQFPKSDLIASAKILGDRLNEEEMEFENVELEATRIQISAVDTPGGDVAAADLADAEIKERSPHTSEPAMIAMSESKQVLDELVAVGHDTKKRKESAEIAVNKEKPTKPEPEIGMKAFKNYLKTSVVQPTDSICKDVKGKVRLRFFINSEGRPHNIQVIKSLCRTSDSEAIRLIQSGGKWKYGTEAIEVEISF